MNCWPASRPGQRRQGGASLLVGLMILTVLTMLGLVSSSGHLLQQKALAAGIDREHAFHAAERSLIWGYSLLQFNLVEPCTANCNTSSLVWQRQLMPVAIEDMDNSWWQQFAVEYGHDPLHRSADLAWPDATTPPRIVITEVHRQSFTAGSGAEYDLRYFHIYANGYSVHEDNHVIVASTVAIPYAVDAPGYPVGEHPALPCTLAELQNSENSGYFDPDFQCGRLAWREL